MPADRPSPLGRRRTTLAAVLATIALITAVLPGAPAAAAGARPDFKAPWPCDEPRLYFHHSTEVVNAIDYNVIGSSGLGTPVLASAPGTVVSAQVNGGYGNEVVVDHGGGWSTRVAHLSAFSVGLGANVAQGQELGKVGSTGNSSGPHLHFEQIADGVRQPIVIDDTAMRYDGGTYTHTGRNCGVSSNGSTNRAFVYGNERHHFEVNAAGQLVHSWSNPGAPGPQSDIWTGSAVTGKPAAFVHGNEQHVFARTPDSNLAHWVWYPGAPNNLPVLDGWNATGRVASDPTGFSFGDQQHVFYRTSDGKLEHRWWDTSEWRISTDVWTGPAIAGNPVGVAYGGEQHILARTTDNKLAHWVWFEGIANNLPAADAFGTTAGEVTSDPVGFGYGDQTHVFYRSAAGGVQHRYRDASEQRVTADTWPGATTVGTLLAYTYGDEQHLFARTDTGALAHWAWYPTAAGGLPVLDEWSPAGTVTTDPAGFVAGDRQNVLYRRPDGRLENRYWDASDAAIHTEPWNG
ncbi:peptidoglycan DD-metalloendopeptidase family protein [Actinoplanes sp. NPDC051470]|uniref:peptidoglycan DD-metalloendopeptidase family protein n=1 Tax=unclassified Actinoplanes TaxID=2626549 RepID=UPI00342330E5